MSTLVTERVADDQYEVTLITDAAGARTLDGRALLLHRRGARPVGDGAYALPAVLTQRQVEALRAEGYRVDVGTSLSVQARDRAADVPVAETDRFAALRQVGTDQNADRDARAAGEEALSLLQAEMDLSDVAAEVGRAVRRGEQAQPGRTVNGGYLTAPEVETALATLAAAYPAVASIVTLPEPTWEGRTCTALRLRVGDHTDSRIGVLITGSMHAREWGGSDICVALATQLLRAFTDDTALRFGGIAFSPEVVQPILERLDLFILADVNPDGKAFSQRRDPATGTLPSLMWRKNRNPNGGATGPQIGVDPNRNFDFLWDETFGASSHLADETFKGAAPFSEPEVRNVRHLLDQHPHIRFYVDIHCHGGLILIPWGDDETQSDDPGQNFLNNNFRGQRGAAEDPYREFMPPTDRETFARLGAAMNAALNQVRGESYVVQPAFSLYGTTGASDDYTFSRHLRSAEQSKVFSFTIEFGRQFVPPYSEMRGIMADVCAALTELLRHATSL